MNTIHIERTFAAVALRPSTQTARMTIEFFLACLEQRRYPYKEQVTSEFEGLVDLLDYLLMLHGLEHGALILQTADMHIILQPSYDTLYRDEDVSVPSLGLCDVLSAESPLALLVEVNPTIINDKTLARLNRSDQRRHLDAHIRVRGQQESDPQPLPASGQPSQNIVGLASTVLARLGLSVGLWRPAPGSCWRNTSRWRAEEALLALTIMVKNVRIVVGLLDSRSLSDQSTWERVRALLQKEGTREYTLGVFLLPPASPPDDSADWKREDEAQAYTDISLGDIPRPELERSEHWVLQ